MMASNILCILDYYYSLQLGLLCKFMKGKVLTLMQRINKDCRFATVKTKGSSDWF